MNDPQPDWVEDAGGRFWRVGQPRILRDDSLSQQAAGQRICVQTVITLHCMVEPGQPMPDPTDVVRKVTNALTVGGLNRARVADKVGTGK